MSTSLISQEKLAHISDEYRRFENLKGVYALVGLLARITAVLGILLAVFVNLNSISELIDSIFTINSFDSSTLLFGLSLVLFAWGSYLSQKRPPLAEGEIFLAKIVALGMGKSEVNKVAILEILLTETRVVRILSMLGLQRQSLQKISDQINTTDSNLTLAEIIASYDARLEVFCVQLLEKSFTQEMRSLGISAELISTLLGWFDRKDEYSALKDRLVNYLWKQSVSALAKDRKYLQVSDYEKYTQTVKINPQDISIRNYTFREQELDQLFNIMSTENGFALVTGTTGSGKTTLINSLVWHLLANTEVVNRAGLKDFGLRQIDIASILANTESQEKYIQILQDVFATALSRGKVIFLLEDLEQLLNFRPELQVEVVTLLAKLLKNSGTKFITTLSNTAWQKYSSSAPEIFTMFKRLNLADTSKQQSLWGLLDKVMTTQEARVAIPDLVTLELIYNYSKLVPRTLAMPGAILQDFADIDAMRSQQQLEFISKELIRDFYWQRYQLKLSGGASSSPALQDSSASPAIQDKERLDHLKISLESRIIGQPLAVAGVVNALARVTAGLVSRNKPLAGFCFYGPSGIGKTEMAKALAEYFFGDGKLMLTIDMSEFQEEGVVNSLVDRLSTFANAHPYAMVLFDEIDKAKSEVLDLLLQILDEGRVTDRSGNTANFSNMVIVTTTNLGQLPNLIDNQSDQTKLQDKMLEVLKSKFRLELLNRFTELVPFLPLTHQSASRIVQKMLQQEQNKLEEKGIKFIYTDKLIERILKQGWSAEFGARELSRNIQKIVEDKIAEGLLSGAIKPGSIFSID